MADQEFVFTIIEFWLVMPHVFSYNYAWTPYIVLNILLVDDDTSTLVAADSLLKILGYQCTSCTNAKDAFAAYQTNSFDVVITDFQMPGMTGLELIREIRHLNPKANCILMSGFARQQVISEAYRLGASHCFVKPLDLEIFRSALRNIENRNQALSTSSVTTAPDQKT